MRAGILVALIVASLAGTKVPAYVGKVPSYVGKVPAYVASVGSNFSSGTAKHVEEFWPNGNLRRSFDLRDDVRHGEYRTFAIDGKPYEFKHFKDGREDGLQQAWDERGELYLNYEVKNGRRYGMVNAKPCLPAGADGASAVPAKRALKGDPR